MLSSDSGKRLCERILVLVQNALRLIVADLARIYTDVLQCIVQILAVVAEHNRTVVRIVLANQDVAIEAAHLLDAEYTDSAEGTGCNRKNLALCSIRAQLVVCGRLQSVEGDLAGSDIAFDGSVAPILRVSSCHDSLEGGEDW